MYGCADNSIDKTSQSTIEDSGAGDNTGTGGDTDTGSGDNTGTGGDTDAGTGDNTGAGGDTDTGTGDNTGTDGDTDAGTGDNTGTGGNTDTGTGDNTGAGENNPAVDTSKKYTVTFHDNGADEHYNTMNPFTECTSKGIELPENRFIKSGYKFVGWSLTENAEMAYRNIQVIQCNKDIDLYALWEENTEDVTGNIEKYKIFFNGNGGEGTMGSMNIQDGDVIKLNRNLFTRNGYIFMGWSSSKEGVVEYIDEGNIQLNESVTLYAVWKLRDTAGANTVKVVLDPLNNGQHTDTFYVETGKEFYAAYNTLTNGDKIFAGWSTIKNSQTPEYQEGQYSFFYKDTTLYGVWLDKNDVYKVTLDCNGGLPINMPSAVYVQKGKQLFLPRISCDLYNRKSTNKYAETPDDFINVYVAGNFKDIDKDMHLYVLWAVDDAALDQLTGGDCKECAGKTFFAKDVKVPEDDDWVLGANLLTKTVLWTKGVNWFHVYQSSWNLCWAATASNAFHWWTTVNDKYIQAYYKYKESKSETVTKPDLTYSPKGLPNFKQSGVFWEFSHGTVWANTGNNPTLGFIWLVSGKSDREQGGYFKEIFENSPNGVSKDYYNIGKKKFNELITDTIQQKKGVIGLATVTSGPHALTLWGVTYDKNGYIDGIYTTDSAYDGKTANGDWGGLDYDKIIYNSSGKPYIQNQAGYTFPINAVYPFYQNEEDWIRYFEENKIPLPE